MYFIVLDQYQTNTRLLDYISVILVKYWFTQISTLVILTDIQVSKLSKYTFFLTKEFAMLKKAYFNCKIKIKTKTTTIGLKNELEYSPMSEGNTCIAEPNLEVLPLRIIQ